MHPNLSPKGKALIQQYKQMAEQGYERTDNKTITNAFSDFELRAYRKQLKPILQQYDVKQLLDYGCGGSNWVTEGFDPDSNQSATNYFELAQAFRYEPARDLDERQSVDGVICFDVLEHIHAADVQTILRDIFSYATKLVILNIACYPAAAKLPNGENAHITVRTPEWWHGVVEMISLEYPAPAVLLMCSTAWRKATSFPIWQGKHWLESEQFVTPPVITATQPEISAEETRIREQLSGNPEDTNLLAQLGHLLELRAEHNEAAYMFSKVFAKTESNDPIARRYALNLGKSGQIDKAVAVYQKVNQRNADNPNDRLNIAGLLFAQKSLDAALHEVDAALDLGIEQARALQLKALILQELGRSSEAAHCFKEILKQTPDNATTWANLGIVLHRESELADAEDAFRRSIALHPENAEVHLWYSYLLLRQDKFEAGWQEYDARVISNKTYGMTGLATKPWDGTPLKTETLLVLPEQGLGDEIMFASCLPDLMAKESNVILCCAERLAPIFKRSFPGLDVRPRGANTFTINPDEFHQHIAIGSLPRHFRRSLADFPNRSAFLKADVKKVSRWQKRLAALPAGLNIGISWAGGTQQSGRALRTFALDDFKPLFRRGVNVIDLQYGNHSVEVKSFTDKTGDTLHAWADVDPLKNLDEQAAQIMALDAVISVDNTTVHLASALGKPTYVLLDGQIVDWRWRNPGSESLWYSSAQPQWRAATETRSQMIERLINQLGIGR